MHIHREIQERVRCSLGILVLQGQQSKSKSQYHNVKADMSSFPYSSHPLCILPEALHPRA